MRFDNNDSEPKSQVRLLFPLSLSQANFLHRRKLIIFKDTYCQKHSVIFPMSEWEPMYFSKRQLQTTKWKNNKINCNTTGGVPSQIWQFPKVKTSFAFLQIHLMLMYRWWVSSSLIVCYKLVCCRNKTDRNARKSGSKKFSQRHSTLNFWRQVPESEYPEFKIPVYNSFLCIEQHIAVNFFLYNEVRKIKPPCNLEKWTLRRINSHSFYNILSRFSGNRKSNKNFIPAITVHHLM